MKRSSLLGLAVALVLAVGCGGGGGGGGANDDSETGVPLIVQQTWPTNGQEVLSDLSDVGGSIQIKFSEKLAEGSVLDDNNAFNGLSSDLNVLDASFARVPGTPRIIGDRKNILLFTPSGGFLPNGQYTITVSEDVRSAFGDKLNLGRFGHRASFTVGPDTHEPVIRTTYPAQNQRDVPKDTIIRVIFNESLAPATVTNQTVTVVDGGANPPVAIAGTLSTVRDDFEIVFTPDPGTGLPPSTTIVVTLVGGASGITDRVGNPFDPVGGTYTLQFQTVVEPPLPLNPLPVDTLNFDAALYFGTTTGFGVIAEAPFIANSNDMTSWGTQIIDNSFQKLGKIAEMIVESRFGPGDGHTWVYAINETHGSVDIISTRTSKLVHRWRQFADPRGLAKRGGSTLYVTNFGQDTVSAIDISRVTVGGNLPTDELKQLADPSNRLDLTVGRGPTGIAHFPDVAQLMVANQLDNTATLINSSTFKTITTFNVGANPVGVECTWTYPGVGNFSFITCPGGTTGEDNGSVALYWNVPQGLQAILTGFVNPRGITFDYGTSAWIGDFGGDQVKQLQLAFAGGGFAATIIPTIVATVKVGENPVDLTVEPFFTAVTGTPRAIVSADRGSSVLSFMNNSQPSKPIHQIAIPGVQSVAGYMDQ